MPVSGLSRLRMPDDGGVLMPEIAVFGDQVAEALARTVGRDLVGVYFVGPVALGGYVRGESDIDITAVSSAALTGPQRQSVASAVVEASAACPAGGLEFTPYRRDVAGSRPAVLTSRSMPTADHVWLRPCTWTQHPSLASGMCWTGQSRTGLVSRSAGHRHAGSSLLSLAAPSWKPCVSPWHGIVLTRRRPSIRS